MLILLSPAKTQNFTKPVPTAKHTLPQCLPEIATLAKRLRTLTTTQLAKLMSISAKLAELNHQRFQEFDVKNFTVENAKPAIYVLEGDAYRALSARSLSPQQITYLQKHLLILSGLYGYLRPLDLMQAYRLEMGTPLAVGEHKDLYKFWGDKITTGINQAVKKDKHAVVINLASDEYAKAVNAKLLTVPMLTIQFKEKHGDGYRTIGIHAKRARGLMTRFIVENEIEDPKDLQKFDVEGYRLAKKLSSEECLCFVR